MAIQIDLLPGYVGLRRILKWSLGIAVVLVSITGAVLYVLYDAKLKQVQTAQADVETWKPVAAEAERIAGEAKSKSDSLASIRDTVTFFGAAAQTGPRRAITIDMIKNYIMNDTLVASIDIPDGKTVTMVAAVRSTDDYGRMLLNLRKGASTPTNDPPVSNVELPYIWANLPSASGVPGYPIPEPAIPTLTPNQPVAETFPINVTVSAQLLDNFAFDTPLAPGETAPAAAGAAGQPAGSGSATPPR
jgi:hypothetical protein